MATTIDPFIREQLLNRRQRLESAIQESEDSLNFRSLLEEVDNALARIDNNSYGLCEACHDRIECDRLIADPLVRFCLDHLSREEKTALERDLELAARVQRGLLPHENIERHGWHICYHYEPAGLVSGDYCDVIDAGEAGLYFVVGDVSGKGVAASMLMAHLHALFRSLISVRLPLDRIIEHASRVFAESTLPNQYATLVCGRAFPNGELEITNAGHPAPLLVRDGHVFPLESSGLPVGMFGNEEFSVTELSFDPGQVMVVYSDGVSDTVDSTRTEYGVERLRNVLSTNHANGASAVLAKCRDDLAAFRSSAQKTDDVTLFVLARTASA